MAIIDPDGLFNGERLKKCSDHARLYWPYFYLASNGFGRLELDYKRIASRVFSSFKQPTTEDEFCALVKEYRDNYLLFIYQFRGQMWGVWDTDARYLPRHKTAKDKDSPEPPAGELTKFREAYMHSKRPSENFSKLSEIFGTVPKVSAGVGGGVGKGEGEGRDGQADFLESCALYPKPEKGAGVQNEYVEAVGYIQVQRTCDRTDAVDYLNDRIKKYVSLVKPAFCVGFRKFLEDRIFEQPASAWNPDAPVEPKKPVTSIRTAEQAKSDDQALEDKLKAAARARLDARKAVQL